MKKLIPMMAAVACAFGAKADTTLPGGINFDGMTSIVNEGKTAFVGDEDGSIRWLGDIATTESSIVDNYLKVEETTTLQRTINAGGAGQALPENGGSIVISSKVQFTATEEETVKPDEGAKLAIWLRKLEGAETATLMVTSGELVGEGEEKEFKAVDHEIEGVTVNENEWYDLEVTSTVDATGALAFTVKIGETVIDRTFNSLIQKGENKATIASVGFKGTGAVDDIAFTAVEGEVAVPVTLAATVNGEAPEEGVVAIMMGDDVVAEANVGETVKIVVAAEANATVAAEGLTFNFDEGNMAWIAQYELTEADGTAGAKTFAITVETAPGPEPEPIQPTITPEGAAVEGLPEAGFVVGTEYNTANFTVTPAAHKTATVVVKVNGEVVEGAFTLKEGDTVEITVTEEDITFTLTIPEVTGASAAVTDAEGVAVTDLTKIVEGTEVTINWTADTGYEITAGATQTITVTADVTAAEPTVQATTYTISYNYVDAKGVAVTDVANTNPTSYTIETETITINLTLISKDGYTVKSADVTTIETGSTGAKTITVTLEENKGGELPGEGFVEDKEGYANWAAANGITTETEATTDQAADLAVAFLLGANKTETVTLAEAAQAKVDELITAANIDVSKLATGDALTAEFQAALAAKGLQAQLLPTTAADGLVSTETAKFFKLVIKLAVKN